MAPSSSRSLKRKRGSVKTARQDADDEAVLEAAEDSNPDLVKSVHAVTAATGAQAPPSVQVEQPALLRLEVSQLLLPRNSHVESLIRWKQEQQNEAGGLPTTEEEEEWKGVDSEEEDKDGEENSEEESETVEEEAKEEGKSGRSSTAAGRVRTRAQFRQQQQEETQQRLEEQQELQEEQEEDEGGEEDSDYQEDSDMLLPSYSDSGRESESETDGKSSDDSDDSSDDDEEQHEAEEFDEEEDGERRTMRTRSQGADVDSPAPASETSSAGAVTFEHRDNAAMQLFLQDTQHPSLFTRRHPINIFTHLTSHRHDRRSRLAQRHLASRFVPSRCALTVEFQAPVFCGQFTRAGNTFCSASQDGIIRLYHSPSTDMHSRSHSHSHSNSHPTSPSQSPSPSSPLSPFKVIEAKDVGFAVLDLAHSPDERFVIYSSWSHCVHMCNVAGDFELHESLQLLPESYAEAAAMFGIRFSPSGQEVLAGLNGGHVLLYDLNQQKNRYCIRRAHNRDINSVVFLDAGGELFATGGDDAVVRVWDVRSKVCVGGFAGHVGGITCVAALQGGQYLLSNSKDHALKLWDLRTLHTPATLQSLANIPAFDYRWVEFSRLSSTTKGAADSSLCTFLGHSVQNTLIRCSFSPAGTFVCSGSADGCVYIWNTLTGSLAQVLKGHHNVVRDVSWHPHTPQILTSSWDGSNKLWTHTHH